MNTFTKQMSEAVVTYANLSGLSATEILAHMADETSTTSRIVSMLMFAAR